MLRSRDIVAILLTVWLMRLASQESQTLNASLHLAFYTHATVHAPFDVDGDGTVEALAIVSTESTSKVRTLEILDLKPLHSAALSATAAPFRPKTMLAATLSSTTTAMPIKLTTGQIMITHTGEGLTKKKKNVTPTTKADVPFTDRTKHYFCGNDWHHASQLCVTPCPGGTPGECPGDEKCYADTPCNALSMQAEVEEEAKKTNYQLTPAGGLPSVATLFADGTITLHSVTVDHGENGDGVNSNKNLELLQLWSHKITLTPGDIYDVVLMGDVDLSAENAMDGHYGIVLVGGTQQPSSVVTALDVMTGRVLWTTSSSDEGDLKGNALKARGSSSIARRRSKLVSAGESDAKHDIALPNCWTAYRHALFLDQTVKPYWGAADNSWSPVHLDRSKRHHQHKTSAGGKNDKSKKGKKHHKKHDRQWHHRHAAAKPVQGRPNALLQRHKGGIQVRSLKNGRSLCHLSLLDQVVYTDLNHDGTLDQIQAVTSVEGADEQHMEWIVELAREVMDSKDTGRGRPRRSTHLCHLLALSGLPAREQLYHANLCPNARDDPELSAAPPLLLHNGVGRDQQIITALSNGLVSKHDARTGNRLWQHFGEYKDAPTWHVNSNAASVTSLYPNIVGAPILTTGENSMTLLTQTRGKVLATTAFPQTTLSRPLVQDWSGDGTPDVLLQTPDAVWGYRILCKQSRTSSRLLVGLLLVALALALLRNRFVNSNSGGGDKRSTDK